MEEKTKSEILDSLNNFIDKDPEQCLRLLKVLGKDVNSELAKGIKIGYLLSNCIDILNDADSFEYPSDDITVVAELIKSKYSI